MIIGEKLCTDRGEGGSSPACDSDARLCVSSSPCTVGAGVAASPSLTLRALSAITRSFSSNSAPMTSMSATTRFFFFFLTPLPPATGELRPEPAGVDASRG